ncbi:hypothetical protein N7532_007093 [Penicillium argentinense]|uniref:SAM-dependent MTase RsmB/NOP-type domain-containing protein n=1 Tax=Penicillium argentinense TaxID=1131581 RepID=A0A9W9FH48_9EURO|nr:uncharacterized protein N7532_007093 [Penicillium argentinense]KAJ5100092.1 hypothetical protein N7532_007093 [Penicillium argentinense]
MSLYFDAVAVLTAPASGGSFKSRIYSARNLRAAPAQIYALITEASKWDTVLAEVIEKADILNLERKLTPLLALLLVHDHLLAKKGIAAPATHWLRQAVERHKVRLKAEFTKARVRRGCGSVEQLKSAILRQKREADGSSQFVYPRWVRVNNIRSTLEDQLRTTFADYQRVDSLMALAPDDEGKNKQKLLYLDPHIPDLVAVPYGADFTSSPAYKSGEIILQDKASCFPAYLLLGDRGPADPWQGDLVDGCAAPGNKTTHMASLVAKQKQKTRKRIFCMDASKLRSKTLQKMVTLAGADPTVTVLQGQDFLALDPLDERFQEVSGLLLDPSCSGSGIIGRDDFPQLTLPQANVPKVKPQGKKRKRQADDQDDAGEQSKVTVEAPTASPSDENDIPSGALDDDRLTKLSNLQARIVEHALSFPAATHVTYSTCSIHLIENEAVVARILASEVAQRRGWRLLRRDEQPEGLRKWKHRGVRRDRENGESDVTPAEVDLPGDALEACLRCWTGDAEGLGGFFVAGFVRDAQSEDKTSPKVKRSNTVHDETTEKDDAEEDDDNDDDDDDDEWDGFSD